MRENRKGTQEWTRDTGKIGFTGGRQQQQQKRQKTNKISYIDHE